MKQIIQRRILQLDNYIKEETNPFKIKLLGERLHILKQMEKEFNSLRRIKLLPRHSIDILFLLYIYANRYKYTTEEIVDLAITIVNKSEEEVINFFIETRPPDIEDWKQSNLDWELKYFTNI